jgi:hypothetical protein
MTTVRTYYTTAALELETRDGALWRNAVQSKVSFKDIEVNAEGLLAVMIHRESMIKNSGFVLDKNTPAFVPYHAVLLIVALEDK